MALVVVDDADDHRCGVAVDHRLASGLGVQEVSSGLEGLVRPLYGRFDAGRTESPRRYWGGRCRCAGGQDLF